MKTCDEFKTKGKNDMKCFLCMYDSNIFNMMAIANINFMGKVNAL